MMQHDTLSAYNPRTNGLTERFNQTLYKSLRKHAEAILLHGGNGHHTFPYVINVEFIQFLAIRRLHLCLVDNLLFHNYSARYSF